MSFERLEDYPGELNDISDTVAELLAKARRTKSKAARGATAANGAAAILATIRGREWPRSAS